MKNNKNLILLVVIGLIIIGSLTLLLIFNPLKPAGPEGEETGIAPPEATGNVGDLIDALDKEIQDEMNLVYEEDDAELIISDNEAINNFGQSADDAGL